MDEKNIVARRPAFGQYTSPRYSASFSGDSQRAAGFEDEARRYASYLFSRLRGSQSYNSGQFEIASEGVVVDVHVWRRGGHEYVATHTHAEPLIGEDGVSARHLWLPSGFIITPRTADVEHGFGFPKTEIIDGVRVPINPPYGTSEGVFRECLVNKYPGNRYAPTAQVSQLTHSPLAYTEAEFDTPMGFDASGDGVSLDVGSFTTQFMELGAGDPYWRFVENPEYPRELQGDDWVAHFPIEVTFQDAALSQVFDNINALRADDELDPLYLPYYGSFNPAAAAQREFAAAGIVASSSEEFRVGYKNVFERLLRDGPGVYAGENTLNTDIPGSDTMTPEQLGDAITDRLVDDPASNDNIMSDVWNVDVDDWDSDDAAVGEGTVLDMALDTTQDVTLAQCFTKRKRWLYHGNFYWYGDEGHISWTAEGDHNEANHFTVYRVSQSAPTVFSIPETQIRYEPSADASEQFTRPSQRSGVYLHGRYFPLPKASWQKFILGAALRRESIDTDDPNAPFMLFVVAAVLDREQQTLAIQRCRIDQLNRFAFGDDERTEWVEDASFNLNGIYNVSAVRFSPDATKAVFRVESLGSSEALALDPDNWQTPPAAYNTLESDHVPVVGLEADYWEFVKDRGMPSGVFSHIERVEGVSISTVYDAVGSVIVSSALYEYTASGRFAVAKDYNSDNELVTAYAVVNDRSTFNHVYRAGEPFREEKFDRRLEFPSGKQISYMSLDSTQHQSISIPGARIDSDIATFDYLDIINERVIGMRIVSSFEIDVDELKAPTARVSVFMNDDVLQESVLDDPFPGFHNYTLGTTDKPNNLTFADSVGYRDYYWATDLFNNGLASLPDGWRASPNGFIPFNVRYRMRGTTQALIRYDSTTDTWHSLRLDAPPAEQQVDYGSKIMPIADGFEDSIGSRVGVPATPTSRVDRAWSVRGPGYRLYNPNPWFGGALTALHAQHSTAELYGGANLRMYLKNWGQPPLSFFTQLPPSDWPLSSTEIDFGSISGYHSQVNLGDVTELDLVDNIFPIGLA